eukprot:CAMPEP_0203885248 /NCGR_PEP_ID=MMETSP0359-20131031/29232_1 /ASSEMBLY_ACC=CAM_ASM_000338 /TAXON_ID=268821 /ORGANISM="Scrippsiella Hangoei, Strain SHTV-5" /LENGTH=53 /DNA_ID=CAMNT_0050805845 /DNA_START=35 /DNA_END=193 /DNA_ORIENTATION=-
MARSLLLYGSNASAQPPSEEASTKRPSKALQKALAASNASSFHANIFVLMAAK